MIGCVFLQKLHAGFLNKKKKIFHFVTKQINPNHLDHDATIKLKKQRILARSGLFGCFDAL